MADLQDIMLWLLTPLSGAIDHAIAPELAWHGRLMVGAWGMAAPLAILFARYYKITLHQNWPTELDNRFWWHAHRALNYSALVVSSVAALLLWGHDGQPGVVRDMHVWMGWSLITLGWLQGLGGHLRGTKGGPTEPRRNADGSVRDLHGDHYDMSARRIRFEWLHKTFGYLALLLAMITMAMGLWIADAPRWMVLGLASWWLALLMWAAHLQAAGRCVDTYQAIWGVDPSLPGLAVPPVGRGIRRLSITTTSSGGGADRPWQQ